MATGCTLVIRKWINILWIGIIQEWRYELGFGSVEEIANTLEKVIKHYDNFDVEAIASRTL